MTSLCELLQKASTGDKDSLLNIVLKFQPLLRKYARFLNYEDAYNDLECELMVICKTINLSRIKSCNEAVLVSYIKTCVLNCYKSLLKRLLNDKSDPIELFMNEDVAENYIEIWDKLTSVEDRHLQLEFDFLESILTEYEAKIITMYYFYQYSVKEIAVSFGVSSPAICQAKTNALRKLKNNYITTNQ